MSNNDLEGCEAFDNVLDRLIDIVRLNERNEIRWNDKQCEYENEIRRLKLEIDRLNNINNRQT